MVNKIRKENELTSRVNGLGLSYAEVAIFSGYSIRTLHNISSQNRPIAPQLNASLKVMEILAELGQLQQVFKKLLE